MKALLDYQDLRARGVPYSKCQIWRLEKLGRFPAPVRLSINRKCWSAEEVDQWIAEHIARRDLVGERA